MPRLAIAFHSAAGTTRQLAAAVKAGAVSAGFETRLIEIEGEDIAAGRYRNEAALEAIDQADAVVFGAPTFMGGPSAQFKAFADATSERWEDQRWRDKFAAGFTTGGVPNGDQTGTLQYFTVLAAQHGMIWVGVDLRSGEPAGRNRLGVQSGASAWTAGNRVEEQDLETARYLGARMARFVG